jgi:hypothetical protein
MKWDNRYPPTNTSLDYINRRQQRRMWRLKLRGRLIRLMPRLDRSPKANHNLHPRDLIGVVTPARNPLPREEYELILWSLNHRGRDEAS